MITIDARGEQCPIPVVKTKKAIGELKAADTVVVLVDNEIAVQNIQRLASSIGATFASEQLGEKEYRIELQVGANTEAPEIECEACTPTGDFIAVISSATMGVGNDELGKVLMKGYIYALSQLDVLPKKVLFYNGGVTLTTEGSASIEDLQSMAAQGVEILSCGTCLDYYGRKDKLLVGGITNMYTIVESMAQTGKVIRP